MENQSSAETTEKKAWYAFYVKPRHEKKLKKRLQKSHEIFCPLKELRVRWSDRWKTVQKPLLPGYLFARVTNRERLQILQYPSVFRTVCWKGRPAVIRDDEIDTMKRICGHPDVEEMAVKPVSPGDRVQIEGGELANFDGVVVKLKGNRAELFIESLNCNLTFTVQRTLLKPV